MAYTQTANTVYILKEKAEEIDRYLNTNPLSPYECLSDGQVVCTNVSFPDGYHMKIRCVGVEYEAGGDNTAYAEALLFDRGNRLVRRSDVTDEYFGYWELYADATDTWYCVAVMPEPEEHITIPLTQYLYNNI